MFLKSWRWRVSCHLAAHISAMGTPMMLMSSRGHTRGSVVYLLNERFLFAGDSFAFDPEHKRLTAFRDACWYSWSALGESLAKLADYRFVWLLPGHGWPVHLVEDEMRARLRALVARMRGD